MITTTELKKELIAKIEPIIEKNGTANFASDSYVGFVPVVYPNLCSGADIFTLDRVYMQYNDRLKKREVAADFSSCNDDAWNYLRNLPVELAEEILDCLENEDCNALFFDDADEEDDE